MIGGGVAQCNISGGKLALQDRNCPQSDLHQTLGRRAEELCMHISKMLHDQLAMSPLSKGGVYHG